MRTFIQISDTHLGLPEATERWNRAMRLIAERRPDFVLHTGDITERAETAKLAQARKGLAALGIEWRMIPGNHDIGDGPPKGGGPDSSAVTRFEDAIGPTRFTYTLGTWTIIAFSGLELGTGGTAEADLWRWLDEKLGAASEPVALALHKPVFVDGPDDRSETSDQLPVGARSRLWQRIVDSNVQLVLSGHRHTYRVLHRPPAVCVWGPALAGPPENTPPLAFAPSPPALLEYRVTEGGVHHQLVPLYDGSSS